MRCFVDDVINWVLFGCQQYILSFSFDPNFCLEISCLLVILQSPVIWGQIAYSKIWVFCTFQSINTQVGPHLILYLSELCWVEHCL
ncbi:hypothetical protein HAX54_029358 [Datura stramonium]|uniref:Uncharacterized protein n=1 Tax=Datura stramonium TaxID=4076 RepID=A0ABS8V800_DATST|nr:hypothetical protein [Datura stramonium]